MIDASDQTRPRPALNCANVNVTSTGDVQVIVRESGPGEPWFQMLRKEFEDGTWAALLDRHRNLLPVMCSLRDRETGLAFAPSNDFVDAAGIVRPGLLARTGLKKSALYQAIGEMASEPASVPLDAPAHLRAAAGLLARCGRDLYAVLPDRVFAGRKAERPESAVRPGGKSFRPDGIDHEPFRPGGKVSAQTESPALLHRETQARSEFRIENSSSTTTNLRGQDWEEAIGILTRGLNERHRGFGRRDAERLLARTGVELNDVLVAAANAAYIARSRQGLRSWTGYVRTQLEAGCSLFPALQRDIDNAHRVADRIRRCGGAFGDEAMGGRLQAWAERVGNRGLSALMADPAWHADDESFWQATVRRVEIEIGGAR